jgi:hypothetical protein
MSELESEAIRAERDPDLIEERIWTRLKKLYEVSAQTPHYSSLLAQGRPAGSITSWLDGLPILSRSTLQRRLPAMLAPHPGPCILRSSSGTLGQAVPILRPRESLSERAAIERRWFSSLGLPTSFAVTFIGREKQMESFEGNFHTPKIRLRGISRSQASEKLLHGQLTGDLLVAAPSVLSILEQVGSLDAYSLTTSFEFPEDFLDRMLGRQHSRRHSSEVYAAGELTTPIGFRFPDCPSSDLHLNMDSIYTEVVDVNSGHTSPDGGIGRIVCTDLLNTAVPLIRYDVGDIGLIKGSDACPCGRTTPRLVLLGRRIPSDDGRLFWIRSDTSNPGWPFLIEHRAAQFVACSPSGSLPDWLHQSAADCGITLTAEAFGDGLLGQCAESGMALSIAERPLAGIG